MKIILGSDHGGLHLKEDLEQWLVKLGHEVEDVGPYHLDPEDDYPQFAHALVARLLQEGDSARGILICRGANGMAIAANRHKTIRASVITDTGEARMTRNDNDSNVLCLSARQLSEDEALAKKIVSVWLDTPFSRAPRHQRRIRELDDMN